MPANGYASEAGPFNPKTGLVCANQADRVTASRPRMPSACR